MKAKKALRQLIDGGHKKSNERSLNMESVKKASTQKRVYRTASILACVVAFATTYMLILPAITVEKADVDEQLAGVTVSESVEGVGAVSGVDAAGDVIPSATEDVIPSETRDLALGNLVLITDEYSTDPKAHVGIVVEAVEGSESGQTYSVIEKDPEEGVVLTEVSLEDPTVTILSPEEAAEYPEMGAEVTGLISAAQEEEILGAEEAAELEGEVENSLAALGVEMEEEPSAVGENNEGVIQSEDEDSEEELAVTEEDSSVQAVQDDNGVEEQNNDAVIPDEVKDPEDAKALEEQTAETGISTELDNDIATTTYQVANYLLSYTVDFHWDVDGKNYEFNLPGGGFISLTELVEALGVVGDNGPESLESKALVANIEKVVFSSPKLLSVSKAEEDTTVGAIKDALGLECEYSVELTEEQIEEIDAQMVRAGDWSLISLCPFDSEETLTVTMKDGDRFVVKVTDAQLKKTVISASGETYEVIVTYDNNAQIPEGANLKITEFAEDSKEYQAAREAVVDKKQSEDSAFDEKEFGVAAFDLTIVDKEGKKVEPKTVVEVSMKMRSLPEEAVEKDAQYTIEIHHLNESSGDIAVETVASALDGNIQVEEETAQAEFQLESFSTFTISWSENTSNTNTTLRWTYTNNYNQIAGRVNVRVNYVDQNGNAISRPSTIGWTVDRWVGDSGEVKVDLAEALAKDIPGYTFNRAYISNGGTKSTVSNAVGKTEVGGGWRNNTLTLYDDNSVVYTNGNYNQNSYDAPTNLLYLEYSGGPHTTVHYGYMDGDTFVEFPDSMNPSEEITATDEAFGWHYLIYDFYGTGDDGKPIQYNYKSTYYSVNGATDRPSSTGTQVQPVLRFYNKHWTYFDQMSYTDSTITNNNNWKNVANGSDIYVVYEKPTITNGGSPTLKTNAKLPDEPDILKQSVENGDGTNTLSLSITGSTAPMEVEKLADVIVILDLSSSMRKSIGSEQAHSNYISNPDSRYYQAKRAIQNLADKLYQRNSEANAELYRMGLITFSNKARVRQQLTGNQSEYQASLNGITEYESNGTNWEYALQLANEMSLDSGRATYVVFVTDGEPTLRQTRLELKDTQLTGNNSDVNTGDIYHGGLAGGRFSNSSDKFRDYLGSATFGGLNGLAGYELWIKRNKSACYDEVQSMVDHNKDFYAIGISNAVSVDSLDGLVTQAGLPSDHSTVETTGDGLARAFETVLAAMDGKTGQADIKMFDGITDLTQTISKVNQEENRLIGADGNFTYWKSIKPEGWDDWSKDEKTAYTTGMNYAGSDKRPDGFSRWTDEEKAAFAKGQNVTFTEWTTRETDGCEAAVYNTETGAVEWNMGDKFMLEDGVTYKVSFICWPSQEAYDIIAKLNNGTITFGDTDLYPQEIWDQFEGDITNGYTLKTNTEGANTKYSKATNVNGNVTVGDEQDPLPFQHVPPMPLDKDKLNVAKTWQASRIDSQTPESVILQVVGDDELYKQFEITPTETVDGSDTPNMGRSDNIYISCGHLKVNKSTGEVVIYESGHDFTLREVGENSRHWDLDASICRPMKINMEETMLVLVEEDGIPNDMKTNLNLAYLAENGNEYYRVDGNVYKVDEALTDITGFNTRRSFLDLSKEVLVNDEVWPETVDEVFTYKIKINIDPTTLSWDPDLEKYIIISTRDANGTVLPSSILALADAEHTPTAKLPSQCGFAESNDTKYLVAENDVEFYLSIKNGWSVRFLNLPAGTTYSIEEVFTEDSNYDFNNVRLETRKDRTSATPVSTNVYNTEKLDGSIEETSTLYKVVYRNAAKTKEVQILKTGQDASTPLGGAKFDLYTESDYTSDPQGAPYKTNLVSSEQAETKGKIELGNLPVGKYYLVETKAPDGYNMRTEPVVITVTRESVAYDDGTSLSQGTSGISHIGNVYQLKVTNDEGVALPNTGGPGTEGFLLMGGALVIGATAALLRRKLRA